MVTGHRYLGSFIGTREEQEHFVDLKAKEWETCVKKMSSAAEQYPHESLTAFNRSLQHEWGFVSSVIPECVNQMSAVENTIKNYFVPALLQKNITDIDRETMSLPVS